MVILEKSVFGKKILHQPLVEVNAVAAGKVAKILKVGSKVVGGLGVVAGAIDISQNGLTTSNTLDMIASGMALSGFWSGIAGTYFC